MSDFQTQAKMSYFGKIPSRGDFVKAADNPALLEILDEWLTETMRLLAEDPRWKSGYDIAKPVNFAFLGPQKSHAIAGHIIASNDMAYRRFPFLTMGTLDIPDPLTFVASSPLILSKLWHRLETHGADIMRAENAMQPLQTLSNEPIAVDSRGAQNFSTFDVFLKTQHIASLQHLLVNAGFEGNVRHLVLAIGLLLQPVMTHHTTQLSNSLSLPLPIDKQHQSLVASFWMHLISPFLVRLDLELSLFFTEIKQRPTMVIGFNGASSVTLQAILLPQAASEHLISLESAEWVEEQVDSDYGIKKLASYLALDDLSLHAALEHFQSIFIGR